MRRVVTGEQVAQIYNPDPFARPVFRAPVYQTPAGLILIAWLARLIGSGSSGWSSGIRSPPWRLAVLAFMWVTVTWVGVAAMIGWASPVLLAGGTTGRPGSPGGSVRPARGKWRAWTYRRRWAAVMTIADLAPCYRGRIILPVLGKVTATRYVDRVSCPAGLRAVRGRFRRAGRQPGPRVRRPAVPGPHRPVGRGGAGVRPP